MTSHSTLRSLMHTLIPCSSTLVVYNKYSHTLLIGLHAYSYALPISSPAPQRTKTYMHRPLGSSIILFLLLTRILSYILIIPFQYTYVLAVGLIPKFTLIYQPPLVLTTTTPHPRPNPTKSQYHPEVPLLLYSMHKLPITPIFKVHI